MPSGKKCRAAALGNTPYCYFHTHAHRLTGAKGRPKNQPLELPLLEDRSAIQLALTQILEDLAAARIDSRQAGLLLYGLQIASQNVNPGHAHALSSNTVQSVTRTRDGRELAPVHITCDTGDCDTCHARKQCVIYRISTRLTGSHPDDEPDVPGGGELPAQTPTRSPTTVAKALSAQPIHRLVPSLDAE